MNRAPRAALILLLVALAAPGFADEPANAIAVDAPPPVGEAPEDFTPEEQISSVYLPVAVSIDALQQRLEDEVPRSFDGQKNIDLDALKKGELSWRTERRAIRLSGAPGALRLNVAIDGGARVKGKIKLIVKIPVSARADLSATLDAVLRPELQTDWSIAPNIAGRVTVQNAEIPIKHLGTLSLQSMLDGPLDQAARMLFGKLEQRLEEDRQLKQLAEKEWRRLHRVEQVSDAPNAWLVIRPRAVVAEQPRITTQNVELGLGITAITRLVVTDKTPDNPPTPLPPLQLGEPRAGLLDFRVLGSITWDRASRLLTTALAAQPLILDKGLTVKVTRAELQPSDDKLVLAADIHARHSLFENAAGRIYLVARPRLDADKAELRLEDVDLTTETRDALLASAVWLLKPALLEAIRQRAVIDLQEASAEAVVAANRILAELARKLPDGVDLQAEVAQIRLERIVLGPRYLYLLAAARGNVRAQVSRIDF